jgi:hypothetical protein
MRAIVKTLVGDVWNLSLVAVVIGAKLLLVHGGPRDISALWRCWHGASTDTSTRNPSAVILWHPR